MGFEYCRRMWNLGHYQFFPLLIAVVAWIIYVRLSKRPLVYSQNNVSYALLAVNLLLLVAAVLLYSSTLWIISLTLFVGIWIHDQWGWSGCRDAAPAWALMLFVIPLPSNLDLQLITKMQFLASQLASWVLDAFGQTHFREGVVLVTEKKQFFAEEACSGIRSLFSSLAAISIYGVTQRYSIGMHVFNFLQTALWVVVGNALRIAIVVYVSDNWTESIATGTTHEMLGLVVFLFIFGLAISTDRAVESLIQRARDASIDEEPTSAEADQKNRVTTNIPSGIQWALVGGLVVVSLFSARLTYAKMSREFLHFNYFTQDDLVPLSAADLPSKINGWELGNFEHKLRDDKQLLAPESFLWTYNKDGLTATISLDSPYREYHNLTVCYSGLGWSVEQKQEYADTSTPVREGLLNESRTEFSTLEISKRLERGVVYFTAFDRNGSIILPNFVLSGQRSSALANNIRLAFGILDPSESGISLPVSQIQLLHTSNGEIRMPEDIKSLFLTARQILQKSPRFTPKQPSPSSPVE